MTASGTAGRDGRERPGSRRRSVPERSRLPAPARRPVGRRRSRRGGRRTDHPARLRHAQDEVVQRLGGTGGIDQSLIRKALPLLAPLVLSYLAKRMGGSTGGSGTSGASGGIGQIIESVLQGAGSPASAGGASSGASSSIIDVLGGLLGGGRR